MLPTYLFVLTFLFISDGHCDEDKPVNPVVKTPLGTVRGYFKTSFDGRKFSAFEGIPYAKPPIGESRFEEPEPIEPWIGTWNANFLTRCAQTLELEPNVTTGSEDCLHVNVYVPRESINSEEKLEVVVHIHGGGYMYGSSNRAGFPEQLMDRDLVYVTFNFRLGILGFLGTEDDVVPGNNGLKDQAVALKWIQKNIANFGGNPNSVTITGLSAGGSSVHMHYFSEWSKGLFHRGSSQSGSALSQWSISEEPLSKAKKLGDAVGCPSDSTKAMVKCLKQRPLEQVLNKMPLFLAYGSIPKGPFAPVVEKGGAKPFLNDDPYNLLVKGHVEDLPWITSTTSEEGFSRTFFFNDFDDAEESWEEKAPFLLDFNYTLAPSLWKNASRKIKKHYFGNEKISNENMLKLTQILGDRFYVNGVVTAAALQSKVTKSPVYYYIFAYVGDNNDLGGAVGHAAEEKYMFGDQSSKVPLTADEIKMKNLYLDMIVSFAKTSTPKFKGIEWKPTSHDRLTYLKIAGTETKDIELETTDVFTGRNFWNSLGFSEGDTLLPVGNRVGERTTHDEL